MLIPLIAKPDGTLLARHNRLKIAKELKHKTIPVRIVESVITDTVELEILVKDNVLRRQLTAQQKKNLIKRLYGKEIMKAKHGGSRGNQHSKQAKARETVNGISKLPKEDQKKALKWLQAELKKSK